MSDAFFYWKRVQDFRRRKKSVLFFIAFWIFEISIPRCDRFRKKYFLPPLNSLDLCNNIFTHDRSVLQIRNNELLQPILIISLLDEKGSTPEGPSKCFRRVFTVVRGAQTPINKSDRRSSVRVYRGKLRCELLITIIAF